MKIKAAVTMEQGQPIQFKEVELSDPKDTEVQVRMVASGVCHTDHAGRDHALTPYPVILGHEGAGVVEAIGDRVKEFEVGDHVVMSYAHCGHCSHCLSGYPTTCLNFNELNFGGHTEEGGHYHELEGEPVSLFFGQSSFATHANVEEKNLVKVPKDFDLVKLAPLGCGIQTGAGTVLNAFDVKLGDSIVILGVGAVGLSAIMAAKIAGYKHIIAVNRNDDKLEMAEHFGATDLINNKKNPDIAKQVKEITGGGAKYAIDTTGNTDIIVQGLHSLQPRGEMAVVGMNLDFQMDMQNDLMAEGKTMRGVIEGDSIPKIFIPELIDYYRQGKFPFDDMITVFDFEDLQKAFEERSIKPVVKIS